MSEILAAVVAGGLLATGALVWVAVLLWVTALLFSGSQALAFGCARCDWEVPSPRRKPRWLLQIRYRRHCVARHHDWPPHFVRETQPRSRA